MSGVVELRGSEVIENLKKEFGKEYLFIIGDVSFTATLEKSEDFFTNAELKAIMGHIENFVTSKADFTIDAVKNYFYEKRSDRIIIWEAK